MRYKSTQKSLPEIARELGVDGVVEGSIKIVENRIRINVSLVHCSREQQLWAAAYERDLQELERLPEQAALAIAHEVSGQLALADRTHVARQGLVKPAAYEAYLRGRYLWNQRGPVEVVEASEYFQQALREDPGFALAWSGLADCSTGWDMKKDYNRAEQFARKALALDPNLAEAHASLGVVLNMLYRFDESDIELRRAIALNPNYAMAHHWYAYHLLHVARATEALAENDRALLLDPFSIPVNYFRIFILIRLRAV
jgi:Tfp pilus assembly protein PilF